MRGHLRAVIDEADIAAFRARAMTPDQPSIHGTAQNPDVYFQSREAGNRFHARVPEVVQAAMDRFAAGEADACKSGECDFPRPT